MAMMGWLRRGAWAAAVALALPGLFAAGGAWAQGGSDPARGSQSRQALPRGQRGLDGEAPLGLDPFGSVDTGSMPGFSRGQNPQLAPQPGSGQGTGAREGGTAGGNFGGGNAGGGASDGSLGGGGPLGGNPLGANPLGANPLGGGPLGDSLGGDAPVGGSGGGQGSGPGSGPGDGQGRGQGGEAAGTAAPAPGLQLVNRDFDAVVALYVSLPGAGSWTELLHGQALQPRTMRRVAIPSGRCASDVRAVFRDGTEREARGVPVCRLQRLVLPRDLAPQRNVREWPMPPGAVGLNGALPPAAETPNGP